MRIMCLRGLTPFYVDFYSYIKELMKLKQLLIKKIILYKKKKKEFIKQLKRSEKIKIRFNRSKAKSIRNPKKLQYYSIIEKFTNTIKLMEKLLELLWNTPLYTHTIHTPTEYDYGFLSEWNNTNKFEKQSPDSIFLLYIKYYEKKYHFTFDEKKILDVLKNLRDNMAEMWFSFKEKHYRFAISKLNELSNLSLDNPNYNRKVEENLNNLIPIFSIYEIFNRALSESVYPESIPQTKRFGAYFASFLASRYNIFGVNLMHLFNKLNINQFFQFVVKLPIWKYIPAKVKIRILKPNLPF
jgi:hypothetical protein